MQLVHDTDGAPVDAARAYHYVANRGPRLVVAHAAREPGAHPRIVRGSTLQALAAGRFPDAETASEAKHLMRDVLDHHLEERRIVSRRVVRDLVTLEEEGP
jgi:DNA repair protein RecO (recombination protein O)